MESLVTNYFKDLFSSHGCNPDPILRCVHRKMTDEQNRMLTKRFVASEIEAAGFCNAPGQILGTKRNECRFFSGVLGHCQGRGLLPQKYPSIYIISLLLLLLLCV